MRIPEEGLDGGGSGTVSKIIKSLMPENDVKFVVIGWIGTRRGYAMGPLRIKFKSLIGRRRLLARNKELRNKVGIERIYMVPDLTKVQRQADKKLREEVKALRLAREGAAISMEVAVRGAGWGLTTVTGFVE